MRMRQHTDKDAEKAYASEKRVYYAKREFAERYEVSADKKFIFPQNVYILEDNRK